MAFVPPVTSRATVEESPESLTIVVPAQREWKAAIFLVAWLVGWLVGEVFAVSALVTGTISLISLEGLFMAAWVVGWTVGGFSAAKQAAWLIDGRDRLVVTDTRLFHHREALGLTKTNEYDLAQVSKAWLTRTEDTPNLVSLAIQYGTEMVDLVVVGAEEGNDLLRRVSERMTAATGRQTVMVLGEEADALMKGELSDADLVREHAPQRLTPAERPARESLPDVLPEQDTDPAPDTEPEPDALPEQEDSAELSGAPTAVTSWNPD